MHYDDYSCKCRDNLLCFVHFRDIIIKSHSVLHVFFVFCEVDKMEVSYKKLWKILIDKDMKKKDLQAMAGISWASVTKLSKGETVSMEVLMKICKTLNCDIGDIMELISDENL